MIPLLALILARKFNMIEELDEDEIPPVSPDTSEIIEFIGSYRNKIREMLDLNFDGQEDESDYKPHER